MAVRLLVSEGERDMIAKALNKVDDEDYRRLASWIQLKQNEPEVEIENDDDEDLLGELENDENETDDATDDDDEDDSEVEQDDIDKLIAEGLITEKLEITTKGCDVLTESLED